MFSVITLAVEFVIKAFLNELTLGSGKTEAFDIAFIGLFSLAFMYDLGRSKKLKSLSFPLFLGYIFRVALLFWDIYCRNIYILPNSGADTEMFYRQSKIYMNTGYTARGLFPKVMGTIFTYIGDNRLFGQYIIMLFSIVSLIIFALILSELQIPNKNKQYACMIVSLLPNLAIVSVLFLRESITAMFVTVSFYVFLKWFYNSNFIYYIMAFISAFVASAFHSGCAAVAGGYVAIILLYDRNTSSFRLKAKNIIPTIVLLMIISFLYVNYGDVLFGKMQGIESLADVADDQVRGNTSYAPYVGNSNNPLNMLIFTIPRVFFFIASPLPFQWRGLSDIIAFCFSSLFFIYVAWCDIKYLRSKKENNRTIIIALSIIILCTFFVFGWGVANAGTACRHRDKITTICGLLLALTYTRKNKYSKE